MFGYHLQNFRRDEGAAIAPLYALALFALVGAAGIGFDYARLASLDTELQNAADHAALAAATQLDGGSGAQQRAIDAVDVSGGTALVVNSTLFANDGGNGDVSVPTVTFYSIKPDAENDTNGFNDTTDSDLDAEAHFVRVRVEMRTANYALTPIVNAIKGDAVAEAVAGIGTALCKTPPLMMCNPSEPDPNSDPTVDFDVTAHVGDGLRLVSVGGGPGHYVPGNFGYLQTPGGNGGATGLRQDLGWETPPGECLSQSGVDTKTGANVSVTDALNTRFDIYDGNTSCQTGGICPSSINSRKDVRRPKNANGNNKCKLHNQGWQQPPAAGRYLPTSATAALPTTTTPQSMGHPRDICHAAPSSASGFCSGIFGNGFWDRDAYFRSHYGWNSTQWKTNTGLDATATRYEVYTWEIDNRGTTVGGVNVLGPNPSGATGGALVSYGQPVCSSTEGGAAGTVPGGEKPDRRRIPIAVINCVAEGVGGSSTNVPVLKWVDVFLVQPSLNRDRTNQGDIYVEVIEENGAGGNGAAAGQVVRRDKPYLLK